MIIRIQDEKCLDLALGADFKAIAILKLEP